MKNINIEEYLGLARHLEQYHSVFQQFWEMGKPLFTTDIPTACIQFNAEGHFVAYLFNPEFYKTLSIEQKAFVIAHESLHVILNHGERSIRGENTTANIALDIVVNHMLVRDFGMDRSKIDPHNKYCWIDTVFSKNEIEKHKIKDNWSFEHYYNLLVKKTEKHIWNLVDDHSNFGESGEHGVNQSNSEDILSEIAETLDEDAKESLVKTIEEYYENDGETESNTLGNKGRGVSALGALLKIQIKEVKKKKKWETIIKDWARKKIKVEFAVFEHWARINRRGNMLPEDIILPSEMELEDLTNEDDKIFAYFFLDTSGSCAGYSQRFFDACCSLPTNRIEARFFSFDTSVYPACIQQGRLYGGGGTYFHIMEDRIQDDLKKGTLDKYPDGVFVLTDGYGNNVHPQFPERWIWMMTAQCYSCIPEKSRKYMLKDFE